MLISAHHLQKSHLAGFVACRLSLSAPRAISSCERVTAPRHEAGGRKCAFCTTYSRRDDKSRRLPAVTATKTHSSCTRVRPHRPLIPPQLPSPALARVPQARSFFKVAPIRVSRALPRLRSRLRLRLRSSPRPTIPITTTTTTTTTAPATTTTTKPAGRTVLRTLFPPSVADRYRDRLLGFRLDTLPHFKHRLQSRIYRYLVEHERKKQRKRERVLLGAAPGRDRHAYSRQLFFTKNALSHPALLRESEKKAKTRKKTDTDTDADIETVNAETMTSQWAASPAETPVPHERGSRRRKLAAMAGSVYRAGVAAATELKEQYNNRSSRGLDANELPTSIPESFPDVAIVTRGEEQMVLFPSYAKRHGRAEQPSGGGSGNGSGSGSGKHRAANASSSESAASPPSTQVGVGDEEYWRNAWTRMEDAKAVVDVDVRGWIYSPHKGPMTRRNRVLIGLARRLSGIPSPAAMQGGEQTLPGGMAGGGGISEEHEHMKEEQRINKEAHEIERKGQEEKNVASRGGYSEHPKDDDSEETEADQSSSSSSHRIRNGMRTPTSAPSSPTLTGRSYSWGQLSELTEAELAVANANLKARIAPFMTTPLAQLPITVFFYNGEQSQSRTVLTNDSGHFSVRAALEFAPTHVRVLASEGRLSAVEPVRIIERTGISLISDIDDTIKRSNISMGAREIFRNTFIRDLADLTVDGVREWYTSLHTMGVRMHYCSNSPWQLFPVIATFFRAAGLPPGSIHLKQYSGMLQGIFEPVAERKKGTLDRIMRDFPDRKFLLVGDSGEADLEVYTDLAIAHPGRILAVFIRDVTTPEVAGYFDSAFNHHHRRSGRSTPRIRFDEKQSLSEGSIPNNNYSNNNAPSRPPLPSRGVTAPAKQQQQQQQQQGSATGLLIDLSDEPEEIIPSESQGLAGAGNGQKADSSQATSNIDLLAQRPQPPPRPMKPLALRGSPSDANLAATAASSASTLASNATRGSKMSGSSSSTNTNTSGAHPLAQMQNLSDQTVGGSSTPPSLPNRAKDAATANMASYNNNNSININANMNTSNASAPSRIMPPPPPPPRRRATPALLKLSPRLLAHRRTNSNNDVVEFEALPGSAFPGTPSPPAGGGASSSGGLTSPTMTGSDVSSKKVELWRRRLARAQETLDMHGVALYTWRRGEDVVAEAEGIVARALAARKEQKSQAQQQQQQQQQQQRGAHYPGRRPGIGSA